MKNKKFKLIIKILLVIFLTILMCENFVEVLTNNLVVARVMHAVIGYITVALIVLHLIPNIGYFKALKKGKYNAKRITMLIINGLMMLSLLIIMLSGMTTMLEKVFNLFDLGGFPTKMHTIATYYLYLLLGLHIGINVRLEKGAISFIAVIAGIAYGITSFILLRYYQVIFFYNPVSHSMNNIFLQLALLPGIITLGFGIVELILMINSSNKIDKKEEESD